MVETSQLELLRTGISIQTRSLESSRSRLRLKLEKLTINGEHHYFNRHHLYLQRKRCNYQEAIRDYRTNHKATSK